VLAKKFPSAQIYKKAKEMQKSSGAVQNEEIVSDRLCWW